MAVAQSGAVAGLVKVLENGSGQAQAAATEALRNLSIDPACCRQISQAAGVGLFALSFLRHLCTQQLFCVLSLRSMPQEARAQASE